MSDPIPTITVGNATAWKEDDYLVLAFGDHFCKIPWENLWCETIDQAIDLVEKKVLQNFRHNAIMACYGIWGLEEENAQQEQETGSDHAGSLPQ